MFTIHVCTIWLHSDVLICVILTKFLNTQFNSRMCKSTWINESVSYYGLIKHVGGRNSTLGPFQRYCYVLLLLKLWWNNKKHTKDAVNWNMIRYFYLNFLWVKLFFHSRSCFSYELWSMDLSLTIQQYFSKSSLFCLVVSSKSGMDWCDITVLHYCGYDIWHPLG